MLHKAIKTIAVLLSAVLLGTLLLGLAFSIPQAQIEPKVARAAQLIRQEGGYPEMSPYATSALDNWTDSIMLMEAAYPGSDRPFVNAMLVPRCDSPGAPYEVFPHYYETGEYAFITEYPNYWHGYLALLKPLLAVLEYSQIRFLNGLVQTLLTLALCFLLWIKRERMFILPYLLCVGLLMPVATARCMQFSSCFYVLSLGSLAVLLRRDSAPLPWYLFLLVGASTSYFDFLTYPVACFGMPALFHLNRHKPQSASAALKELGLLLLAFLLGYGGMWLGKFAIGSLITRENLFLASMDHVNHWVGDGARFSIPYVLYFCLSNLARSPIMLLTLVYALVLCIRLLRKKTALRPLRRELLAMLPPYLLLACLPFVWFILMRNPTGVHGGLFGHKALIVTVFAGLSFLAAAGKQSPQANAE